MSPPSAPFCITARTFLPHTFSTGNAQFTPLQTPTKLSKGAVLFRTKQELSRDSVYSQLPQPKAQQKAHQAKCSKTAHADCFLAPRGVQKWQAVGQVSSPHHLPQ